MVYDLKFLEEDMVALLAGGVAEQLFKLPNGEQLTLADIVDCVSKPGCSDDINKLGSIMNKHVEYQILLEESKLRMDGKKSFFDTTIDNYDERSAQICKKIVRKAYSKTIELLKLHEKEHKKIAQALYEKGTISGKEIYEIVGVNPRLLGFQDDRQLVPVEKYLEYQ